MTDPAPTPKPVYVQITMEDAIFLREEMRATNKGISKILTDILRNPFKGDSKPEDFERMEKTCEGLVDRLTIAIHEATKAQP